MRSPKQPLASVALTVKVKSPGVVGRPESAKFVVTGDGGNDNPGGTLPVTLSVKDVVPDVLVTVSGWL